MAEAHGLRAMLVDDLVSDAGIDVICNLTVPLAHYEVSRAALKAGKHVYVEKPLGVDRDEGAALLRLAKEMGLAIGCAPDTFLGAGLQTCRAVIDEGRIGVPVAAVGNMVSHGPEGWHPDPGFFYQPGAGPLFDMGLLPSDRPCVPARPDQASGCSLSWRWRSTPHTERRPGGAGIAS